MKEIVLQYFFKGHATAQELATDVSGAFDRTTDPGGTILSQLRAVEMNHEFTVDPGHLIKLVDAVQAGALDLDALDTICFCLEASGNFTWDADTPDGERVANGLFWLGSPEVNYALTESVMAKIRDYLVTGRESFTDDDPRSPAEG